MNSGRLKTCPKFFNRLLLNALRNDAPRDLFAGAERDDDIVADENRRRDCPRGVRQHDLSDVARQAVEVRTVKTGERLQAIQRSGLIEDVGIQFDRRVRGVEAGAAAGGCLVATRMRSTVGSQKEARIAASRTAS